MAIRGNGTAMDYLELTAGNRPSLESVTVCGWGKLETDTNNFSAIWSQFNSPNYNFTGLQTDATGTDLGLWCGNPEQFNSMGVSLTVGTWFWWAVRVYGTGTNTVKAWYAEKNGAFTTLTKDNYAHDGETYQFWAFFESSYSEPFDGRLAAIKVFDGTLTDAEVENEMYTIVPRKINKLYAWYPMIHQSKSDLLTDRSGNGKTLTETGGGSLYVDDGPPVSWGGKTYRF